MPSSTPTNLTLRILAIVALTGVLLSPPAVFAADVVVPPTPGWVAAAQAALDNGDTVILEPGGYHFTWDWQSCILRGYVLHLIAQHMSVLLGQEVKPQGCTYHLTKLISAHRDTILMRVREGFYKFRDPLMRAFVRLQLESYNILERDGQIEFAFMKAGKASARQGWAPLREV